MQIYEPDAQHDFSRNATILNVVALSPHIYICTYKYMYMYIYIYICMHS